MTHTMIKKYNIHREKFINVFESTSKPVIVNSIKNELPNNYVSVISLINFFNNK